MNVNFYRCAFSGQYESLLAGAGTLQASQHSIFFFCLSIGRFSPLPEVNVNVSGDGKRIINGLVLTIAYIVECTFVLLLC